MNLWMIWLYNPLWVLSIVISYPKKILFDEKLWSFELDNYSEDKKTKFVKHQEYSQYIYGLLEKSMVDITWNCVQFSLLNLEHILENLVVEILINNRWSVNMYKV